MYRPTRIKMTNLMSHRDSEYTFQDGVAIMVAGENRDDDGQESNGAGKSALIECISIVLTGSSFRKVKDSDMIHYGEDSATVEMEFINEIRKERLLIKRTLFSKKSKSSTLECFINGEHQEKAFPTVLEGNRWILSKLGLSREDLINYFIVSKSKSSSFFNQSDNDKKKIVSRFSGTDSLLPIKDDIVADIKAMDVGRGEFETKLVAIQSKIEAYEEQLAHSSDGKKAFEEEKKSRITSKHQFIDKVILEMNELSKSIESKFEHIEELNGQLDKLKKERSAFKEVDYSDEFVKLEEKESSVMDAIKEEELGIEETSGIMSELKSFISEIEQNIKDSIECPSCHHKFILRDEGYNIEEAREQLPTVKAMLKETVERHEKHQGNISAYRKQVSKVHEEVSSLRALQRKDDEKKSSMDRSIRAKENEIESETGSIDNMSKQIDYKEKSIDDIINDIEVIEKEEYIDPNIDIRNRVKKGKELKKETEKEFDEFNERYEKLKEFQVVFTKFIAHLSNKAVKSIEQKTNQYLHNMGSNLSIEIEGYKVNSDGSIREKFTTIVSRSGIPEAFLESYSEGEQSRINIAGVLAVNNLLNMSCQDGGGLDFVVMDELMGSLDSLGVGLTMEALNKLNQIILAISHVEPKYAYQNTLRVVKENGNSQIVTN